MNGWIEIILLGADCVVLLALLVAGVFPRLAVEEETSRAVRAWAGQWLPLTLAVPWGLTMAMAGPTLDEPFTVWSAAAPVAIAAALAVAFSMFLLNSDAGGARRRHETTLGMTRHQGVMLAGLGVVLFLAASADGLTARHGQILITAAVVWLWISAASRPPIDPAATPARRQRFLIDWSGPLRRPVSTKVKAGVIGAMACVPAIYWICEPAGLTGPSTLLAVMHFGVFAAAAIIVGPGFAQRSAGATLVLSLLLGVGGAALSRIGAIWSIWYGADPLAPVRPTQVLGVSALRSTSILVMAIGVLALLQFRRVRTVSAVLTAAVLFIAAIIVLLSGSEPTLRVMGSAVATAINSLLDAVREAGA